MTNAKAAKFFSPSSDNLAYAAMTVQSLDALAAKRETWESTDFKKANDGLYSLLADCLDVFNGQFVNALDAERKTLRMQLTGRLKAAGIKVQSNTTTLNMFVRYVFGSDRKRAHGYAYVLSAAIAESIEPVLLADWIRQSGGIEKIKRKMVRSEESQLKQQKLQAEQSAVLADFAQADTQDLQRVNVGAMSGEYGLILVKPNPDGSVSVLESLSDISEGLFNELVRRIAKDRVENNATRAQLNAEADALKAKSA